MSDIYDKIKGVAKNLKDQYDAGQKQTSGLGAELAARSQMNRAGEQALKESTPEKPKEVKSTPTLSHSQGPYGSRPGERSVHPVPAPLLATNGFFRQPVASLPQKAGLN